MLLPAYYLWDRTSANLCHYTPRLDILVQMSKGWGYGNGAVEASTNVTG